MPLNIKDDALKLELKQRIEDLDNGREVTTPYMEGMDEMLQRLKSKYANS